MKIEIELNELQEKFLADYRKKASEHNRNDKTRERASSNEKAILFSIENSCEEELRKFEKSDSTSVKLKVDAAKSAMNDALTNAVKSNDFEKVAAIVAAGFEAYMSTK